MKDHPNHDSEEKSSLLRTTSLPSLSLSLIHAHIHIYIIYKLTRLLFDSNTLWQADIVASGRHFIKEGTVRIQQNNHNHGGGSGSSSSKGKKERIVFMFSDAFMIAKEKEISKGLKKLVLRTCLPLHQCVVLNDYQDSKKNSLVVLERERQQRLVFFFRSSEERNQWLNDINSCIYRELNKEKEKEKKEKVKAKESKEK